jgi:glycosyltransferase involved in cell wall biosynthesis
LVVLDADVLGRQRTGDETYVQNLLRHLPEAGADALRFAAVTRHPELVPDGVDAVELPARSQELRMAWRLPRVLRGLRPALAHFQHSVPPGWRGRSIVTVHDLSFERDPTLMGRWDRLVFRTFVPRSVRRADRVFAVSERTRRDLVDLYGIPMSRIVLTPNAVDPAFSPKAASDGGKAAVARPETGVAFADPGGTANGYLLFVGAIQTRKDPLAAADAAREVGLPLVVAGPEKEPALARQLRERGAELRGYVEKPQLADLYRGAAALVLPSRYEGFGLPVLEAMACGTPVVAADDAALREVGGDAAVYASPGALAGAIRRALSERDQLVRAGLERVRAFSWEETARRAVAAYRQVIGA